MVALNALIDRLYVIHEAVAVRLAGTYTSQVIAAAWLLLRDLWVFLVAGAAVSAALYGFLPRHRIASFFKRRRDLSVILCSAVGIVSPMCTYTAIPLVGSLLAMGMPAPPLMAFLVSSPLMNPSLFVYTAGALGLHMAIARTASAFLLGVAAGWLTHHAAARGWVGFSHLSSERSADISLLAVAGGAPDGIWWRVVGFVHEFLSSLSFIGKYFLLGILVAALVQVLAPPVWIASLVGRNRPWSVLLAVALGIPLYACGGGSIPVIDVLMRSGMSPGAALAFFISGPATKVQTIVAMQAVMRRRILVLYLTVMLAGAALCGYLYDFVAPR